MRPKAIVIDRKLLATMPLPSLPEESDKDARGQVLVVGGGPSVPGAPLLTGLAALRAGAGKLQLAATGSNAVALGVAAPEAAIISISDEADGEIGFQSLARLSDAAQGADAVVVGPGMMGGQVARLAASLLEAAPQAAFVLDAAALRDLTSWLIETPSAPKAVLTPHAGEMAGLLGWSREQVLADREGAALEAARRARMVVALKGKVTHVATPDGKLWIHVGGAVGLGTSGSGDVLAGVIAGLLARGATPEAAALRGVYIHGVAGADMADRVGPLGFLAREIVDAIPQALARSAPGEL